MAPLRLSGTIVPGTVAASLVLGWLWLRTESIWLVAIAHGASNNWGQYAFKYMKDFGTPDRDMAVLGAGSLVPLFVGAFLLGASGHNPGATSAPLPPALPSPDGAAFSDSSRAVGIPDGGPLPDPVESILRIARQPLTVLVIGSGISTSWLHVKFGSFPGYWRQKYASSRNTTVGQGLICPLLSTLGPA